MLWWMLDILNTVKPMPTPKPQSHIHSLLTKKVPSLFKLSSDKNSTLSLEDTIKLLKFSADTRNFKLGRTIHSHLITSSSNFQLNVIQTNSLIHFYVKSDEISLARQLFDQMPERNVVSWSSLMVGYFHNGFALEVLNLFKSLNFGGFLCPNEYIFSTVLSSCSDLRAIKEGVQCHGYVLKTGLVFYSYVKNALLHMYTRCLDMEGALGVFKDVPGSDILSYNSIINGFVENGYLSEALEVLIQMVNEYVVWDNVTYVTVLGLCAHLKDRNLGSQVHGHLLRAGIESDGFVGSALIDMYGKCGKTINARNAFDELHVRNVVLWTAIMAAYSQNGCFEEALNLCPEMVLEGVQPNEYSYAVMLNSCAGLSALRHGDMLNVHALKAGFKNYLIVANALINMYSKSGSIDYANQVFSNMIYRDNVTWNSMISGYSHHGLGREALSVFYRMLAAAEVPNYVTFVGVLSACAHLGLVDEGFYYLNHLMKDMRIEPGVEHYTCIVGLLGRAGRLSEAENFMSSIPVRWDVVAWRTLLSACHVHRNISLGKQVAENILKLDPNDVGTYILLSNMYAKARRWDGVVSIRKLMKGKEIKKEPGVSWIQVKNNTHVFVSEDKNHKDSIQIYDKLADLLGQIKHLGYVPDIASVVHDVEDEQKEEYLSFHSEKLAITFGLLNTPSEAPIHVIKNLRMCHDCHTAVKLISKVAQRKIIVRDANRFHCFQSGTCSCGDYW